MCLEMGDVIIHALPWIPIMSFIVRGRLDSSQRDLAAVDVNYFIHTFDGYDKEG